MRKVHVEDLREYENGPVVGTMNRCSNCGHVQKSTDLKNKKLDRYAKFLFGRK